MLVHLEMKAEGAYSTARALTPTPIKSGLSKLWPTFYSTSARPSGSNLPRVAGTRACRQVLAWDQELPRAYMPLGPVSCTQSLLPTQSIAGGWTGLRREAKGRRRSRCLPAAPACVYVCVCMCRPFPGARWPPDALFQGVCPEPCPPCCFFSFPLPPCSLFVCLCFFIFQKINSRKGKGAKKKAQEIPV